MWPWSKRKVASPPAELREMLFGDVPVASGLDTLAAEALGAAR